MDLLTILKIVSAVLGAICTTIIATTIALVKSIKAKKEAHTRAEREKATNDMLEQLNILIETAEETYKQVDTLMKVNGYGSVGALKKETVLSKLQSYAIDRGYIYDAEYWSNKVDEVVALTRKVNAK